MRIVLATPLYPPEIGGPATYTKELALRLKGEHEVSIVALADSPEYIDGVPLTAVSKRLPALVRIPLFFLALIRAARRADIIYVQNAVAAGLPAVFAAACLRKPVVLKFVGDEAWERATQAGLTTDLLDDFLGKPMPSSKIALLRAVQGFVLRRVSCVVPPSAFLGTILLKRYGVDPARIKVNYNAFEQKTPVQSEHVPERIISIGRLVKWKHVDGSIDALKLVREQYPKASMVVVGDGPERMALEAHAKEIGIEDAVTFTGKLSHEQATLLLASAQVHVLNSSYEGLPHVALESFAQGIPMVATDIGGTNEAVIHEQSGLLIANGDTHALAKAIDRIFEDAALGETLVAGAKAILKERFSWESHIATLLAVFAREAEN